MESLKNKIDEIKKILNTEYFPVGIKIIRHYTEFNIESFQEVNTNKRFCYYIRQGAQGKSYIITDDNRLECKTPYFCLGFKEPKYSDFEPRIKPASTKSILIAPLYKFKTPIDSVVFIVNAEQAMLLVDALRRTLKKKINVSFGASMAVCGETIANSIVKDAPSLSLLCFGARIFSEYKKDELTLGIPFRLFNPLYENLKKIESLRELEKELKDKEVR